MDKEYFVRAEFEKTGHLAAWQKLKSHNRRTKSNIASPATFDPVLVALEIRKLPECLDRVRLMHDKRVLEYYYFLVYLFMRRKAWAVLRNDDCCRALMQMAVYRNTMIQDPADWVPSGRQPQTLIQGLMHFVFGRYRVPAFLWNLFWKDEGDYNFAHVMYIMQGRSACALPGLPVTPSKRMAHHFLRAPADATLVCAYRWAQVARAGGSVALYHLVCNSHLHQVTSDETFWASYIRFIAAQKDFPLRKFRILTDYINMKRYGVFARYYWGEVLPDLVPDPQFTFAGRSLDKLIAAAEACMKEYTHLYNLRIRQWDPLLPSATYEYGDWKIEEILTPSGLYAEGKKMKHCVGTYTRNRCMIYSAIFSIRRDGKPHATIEISREDRTVVQAQGPCNTSLDHHVQNILNTWLESVGFKWA